MLHSVGLRCGVTGVDGGGHGATENEKEEKERCSQEALLPTHHLSWPGGGRDYNWLLAGWLTARIFLYRKNFSLARVQTGEGDIYVKRDLKQLPSHFR